MPITFKQVLSDERFKERIEAFKSDRLNRLEIEYQN